MIKKRAQGSISWVGHANCQQTTLFIYTNFFIKVILRLSLCNKHRFIQLGSESLVISLNIHMLITLITGS